ncbi:MAG: M56 family metallopeptidase [Acetatifactor sp.]|nr:M56 family metallopeptidase [Acetatifactor sp.]
MQAYLALLDFAAVYGMIKCLKTMLVGTLVLCVTLPLCRRESDRKAEKAGKASLNLYLMLLVVPAAFMGMSRLFFLHGIVVITALLSVLVKPIHGKLYFAVCIVLLIRSWWRNFQMRRYLRGLPVIDRRASLEERRVLADGIASVTAGDRLWLWRWYLSHVRIYITEDSISPFSGGIFRPYVVMPESVWRDWDQERRGLVLCHELIHLRSGHVFWLTVFWLLKIYWWINPLIHLCAARFQEDMELVCDERCVAYSKVSAAGYGRTMLAVLDIVRGDVELRGLPAFVRSDDFGNLKRRMKNVAQSGRAEDLLQRHRRQSLCFAAAAVLTAAAIVLTSYPLYTKMKELVLYDEELRMVDYDSEALRAAVQVQKGRLVIDEELFGQLIANEGIEGEYVYLSFDTIMKVPGCGGGGNAGMISLEDYEDIWYLAADCRENRIMEFCLKYLL